MINKNKGFVTLTPKNIDSLSESEILDLVKDKKGLPKKQVRLNIIKIVYEILGFDLSNDALLCLLSENDKQLCLATAGGGKTTFAQIKIVLEKMWRKSKINPERKIDGRNVLCLVYNKHNKSDMINKQELFIKKINAGTNPSLCLDTNINAMTMHAFCNLWGMKYAMQMGLINFQLITETRIENMMNMAIDVACKKCNVERTPEISADSFVQLYNYQRETMSTLDQITETDKFIDVGQPISLIRLTFNLFNSLKKNKHVYDFTDMLLSFYDLISTNAKILEEIRSYYDYIVADEVQDFTPIMWRILELISGDNTPLLCIGDEDQNIYSFRGADIYDTLHFKENFQDAETFLLSRNRRCKEKILNVAKSVINKNTLRFDKEILSIKKGGSVELVKYAQQQGEYFNVLKRIKKMSDEELFSTVIAYREKDTSAIFIEYLANADIPFYVISGYKPYSHELYKHLFNVLNILEMPGDSTCLLNLYKVLPISKAEVYRILDYNPATYSFGVKSQRNLFYNIDYGKYLNYNGFAAVMQDLTNISNNIETAPMKSYFNRLFSYVKAYFWKFKKSLNNNPVDDLFEVFIYELFNSDLTYPEFMEQIGKRKELLGRYAEMQTGLAVSTFHGLKGLEFDNVILINMDDSIFPNFSLIDSKDYPDSVNLGLKEAERRLFYVAITRARNSLTIYYNEENPSTFMTDVHNGLAIPLAQEEQSGEVLSSMNVFDKTEATTLDQQKGMDNLLAQDSKTLEITEPKITTEEIILDDTGDTDSESDDSFFLDENGNLKMHGVLDNLESEKSTNAIEDAKTNSELQEEIDEDIKDVTNVELGTTMQELTHQTTLPASSLHNLDLKELSADKKDFKSGDSYINRLFSDY